MTMMAVTRMAPTMLMVMMTGVVAVHNSGMQNPSKTNVPVCTGCDLLTLFLLTLALVCRHAQMVLWVVGTIH